MVDFKKKLNSGEIDKKKGPLEIYNTLDRKSITGPLRPAQKQILETWYKNNFNDRDLIVKLHTGEGKTLIGLLILQSKINTSNRPCLYICPNKYLVEQVCQEAKKFGISYCEIDKDNKLPIDFINGKKLLITHIQKVFNGKSVFGLNHQSIDAECVVLDDSHACIDAIKNSFSIKVSKDSNLYLSIRNLFEDELRDQREGSYLDIENGVSTTLLMIPYWSWIDKKSEVLQLLLANQDDNEVLFKWPILKDCIEYCSAFITGNEVEISPLNIPIRSFGTFYKANQRILMSATTQDDSFFIQGLDFSINSVKKPLIYEEQKWSGEKMVLLPSLIHEDIEREEIINWLAPPKEKPFGVVALVPSYRKSELYRKLGANVCTNDNIFVNIPNLKKGSFEKSLVIVNRYDGIDLPDESCRILIIDSMPYFNTLADKYEEQCRSNSDIINIKIAQKVEQGLGRSVRGEKDYTIILIIGADLVRFINSNKSNKYFSAQTKKQIEIGIEIAASAKVEIDPTKKPLSVIATLINQSLSRDEGWKEFYINEMNNIVYPIIRTGAKQN